MATNKTVFFLIGILLIVLGTSMLAPYMMQVIFKEGSHSFISASFVTIFVGILFVLANLEKEFKLNLRQTFLFSSLAWIMVAIFGSLPFVLSNQNFSVSEAFFESMSGITTTGATMTTIATGGFSTHNDSIGYFKNSNIEIVASIFIILGSIPFISYLKFAQGNKRVFFQDVQIKGLIYLLAVSIIIMFIYLIFINYESSLFDKIRISSFNVISILSGTGYVTDDFGLWGKFSLIFFLLLMFIGGCAGSTACGIKIFRLQMLLIFLKNQIKKLISPNNVVIAKYNNQKISDDFIKSVIIFIFTFLFIFMIIAMLLSISGLDFITSVSGAASAISNVGPGLGEMIGPNGNYKDIPDLSKWILSAGMLLGRLELFAVLVLFFPSFWRN